MGRTIYAEEHLCTYLATLGKSNGYTIGLILGQVWTSFWNKIHTAVLNPNIHEKKRKNNMCISILLNYFIVKTLFYKVKIALL